MVLSSRSAAFSRITALASRRTVHAAFAWLHANERVLLGWQRDLCAIPAPPFGESAALAVDGGAVSRRRAQGIEIDQAGNVLSLCPRHGWTLKARAPLLCSRRIWTRCFPRTRGCGRGADSGGARPAGSCRAPATMRPEWWDSSALAHALVQSKIELPAALLIVGNVGEEGEGDLRGMGSLQRERAGGASRPNVLDSAGGSSAVTLALGSRRLPGDDLRTRRARLYRCGDAEPDYSAGFGAGCVFSTPLPEEPRTILNVGTGGGGRPA